MVPRARDTPARSEPVPDRHLIGIAISMGKISLAVEAFAGWMAG
jgi:hypothetical protein